MRGSSTIFWALACGLAAEAAVINQSPKGFTLVQDGTISDVPLNGALSMAFTYVKYKVPLTPPLQQALDNHRLQRRATGSVPANPVINDVLYTVNIQIGTPPQTVPIDLDTGSADLWVSSMSSAASDSKKTYNPGSSSSSNPVPGVWRIQYGDGSSASGTIYEDVVSVGGVTTQKQAVELATTESSSFAQQNSYSGILGLASSSINQAMPKQKTFFDNVKSQLDAPVFTADLKYQKPGSYDFGFVDKAKYTGDIAYTPVNSTRGFWSFDVAGYQVGEEGFQGKSFPGIADTGTTLLFLPTDVVQAYYAQVNGSTLNQAQGGYTVPCDAELPPFTFSVGNGKITVPPEYLNYANAGNNTCFGGIQDGSSIGLSIFGDVALKSAFVVFEGSDSPRIGWASKNL